jgi:phosphonate degradation associated HDIG domain protein
MFETQAAALRNIYQTHADARYGLETISQLEHALQAAQLAEERNEPPAFVLAALLHDIGHLTANMGDDPAAAGIDNRHEILGADWLAARLPATVSEPVRLHVEAKRYLCATDPSYQASLAPDSIISLRLQGGPMSKAECDMFLKTPFARDAIRLRRLDDLSKRENVSLPTIDHFLRHLSALIPDPVSRDARQSFHQNGFVILRDFFTATETRELEAASNTFGRRARSLLSIARERGTTPAALAQTDPESLIVVPEADNPEQVCRFEYLLGSDPVFAQFIRQRIEPVISALHGEAFLPFKDKENEKHPGGGAFRPHQDFAAYQAFGPRYNATAMISIDPQTSANGCVEFATNFDEVARDRGAVAATIEGRALLHFTSGGPSNGDIRDDIVNRIAWSPAEVTPADLVVFDSFVPHRSASNQTGASRRAMFLTYASQREGDWYQHYYTEKRRNYLDPKFHVSTPTRAADNPR